MIHSWCVYFLIYHIKNILYDVENLNRWPSRCRFQFFPRVKSQIQTANIIIETLQKIQITIKLRCHSISPLTILMLSPFEREAKILTSSTWYCRSIWIKKKESIPKKGNKNYPQASIWFLGGQGKTERTRIRQVGKNKEDLTG